MEFIISNLVDCRETTEINFDGHKNKIIMPGLIDGMCFYVLLKDRNNLHHPSCGVFFSNEEIENLRGKDIEEILKYFHHKLNDFFLNINDFLNE